MTLFSILFLSYCINSDFQNNIEKQCLVPNLSRKDLNIINYDVSHEFCKYFLSSRESAPLSWFTENFFMNGC